MKVNILLLLGLITFSQIFALDNNNNALDNANTHYTEGKYENALNLYHSLLRQHPENASLHYNIGNCYYKLEKVPLSIYHYEKALKINPNHEDAIHNLQLANMRTVDKIQNPPTFFIENIIKSFLILFSYNNWAIAGICLLFSSVIFFIFFLFSVSIKIRKIAFYLALIFTLSGLIFQLFAHYQYHMIYNSKQAILKNTKSNILSAPAENSKKLFVLHEGTKVSILKKNPQWFYISLPNGNKGWVKKDALLEI